VLFQKKTSFTYMKGFKKDCTYMGMEIKAWPT